MNDSGSKKLGMKRFKHSFSGCLVPSMQGKELEKGGAGEFRGTKQIDDWKDKEKNHSGKSPAPSSPLEGNCQEISSTSVAEMVKKFQEISKRQASSINRVNRTLPDDGVRTVQGGSGLNCSESQGCVTNRETEQSDPKTRRYVGRSLEKFQLENYLSGGLETQETHGQRMSNASSSKNEGDVRAEGAVDPSEARKQRQMSFRDILSSTPPQKETTKEQKACNSCGTRFLFLFSYPHNCRFCGKLFCHRCLSSTSILPPRFKKTGPRRVCHDCNARLKPLQEYYGQ